MVSRPSTAHDDRIQKVVVCSTDRYFLTNASILDIKLRLGKKHLFSSLTGFALDTLCRFTLKSIPVTLESSGENRQPPKERLYISRHRLFQRYASSVYTIQTFKAPQSFATQLYLRYYEGFYPHFIRYFGSVFRSLLRQCCPSGYVLDIDIIWCSCSHLICTQSLLKCLILPVKIQSARRVPKTSLPRVCLYYLCFVLVLTIDSRSQITQKTSFPFQKRSW